MRRRDGLSRAMAMSIVKSMRRIADVAMQETKGNTRDGIVLLADCMEALAKGQKRRKK